MPALLVLSLDGQSFIHQCPHCHHQRSELVNPSLNPDPFSYLPNCSGCGQTLQIDSETIHNIQLSYSRSIPARGTSANSAAKAARLGAEKMPDVSGRRTPGAKGGDIKLPGSPEYSAITATRAETDLWVGLPSMLRFEGSLPNLLKKGRPMTTQARIQLSEFSPEFMVSTVIGSIIVQALSKQKGFDATSFVEALENALSSIRLSEESAQSQLEKCVEVLKINAGVAS